MITNSLDLKDSVNNWKRLLELLNGKQIFKSKQEAFLFESCYHGGGSPTNVMVDVIKTRWPKHPLSDFISKLRNIQRNDVANDLEKIMKERADVKSLEDLNIIEREGLKKLDVGNGKSWKDLAKEYDLSQEDRDIYESIAQQQKKLSPTEEVLKIVVQENPEFLLKDFAAILREMGRNDLANIAENKQSQQQQQKQQKPSVLSVQSNYDLLFFLEKRTEKLKNEIVFLSFLIF